jgi:hypothetical protein
MRLLTASPMRAILNSSLLEHSFPANAYGSQLALIGKTRGVAVTAREASVYKNENIVGLTKDILHSKLSLITFI